MTPRRTPTSAPPIYCSQDRMHLLDKRSEHDSGFDPFTGIELARRTHITRECPTPNHDVWVLVGDEWVRP